MKHYLFYPTMSYFVPAVSSLFVLFSNSQLSLLIYFSDEH